MHGGLLDHVQDDPADVRDLLGVLRVRVKAEPARGRGQRGDGEDLVGSPALAAVAGDEVGAGPGAGEGGLGIVCAVFLLPASPAAAGSSMTPVVTCWSQWCSTPPRCQSIPATVQPEATTGVCQDSSGSPWTIFSTESRWYCRKPRSMRDSSSWFTSLTAGDAVSGVVPESAMVPVLRIGPSHPSTADAPGTHRGNAEYQLLVRDELLWPGRCDVVRSRPPGEARTCPARCDDKAGRPGAATARLALRLTILPPTLPPNGAGRRLGGRSRVRAKEPVREAMAEIFPPGWN